MKKSDIRKLISKYREIKSQMEKSKNNNLSEKVKEMERRYFHETGRTIQSDFKEIK